MKIYCKNCKYFYWGEMAYSATCEAPQNLIVKDCYASQYFKNEKTPGEINENNDCKFYKKEWYLFWKKGV